MKTLQTFQRTFTDGEISSEVAKALKLSCDMHTIENLRLLYSTIDLTSLNTDDTYAKIENLTQKVNDFSSKYPELPQVAAICVYPNFVQTVRKTLTDDRVNLASVATGFPSAQTFLEIKTQETRLCVQRGADEVDMVISVGEFLGKDYAYIFHEVKKIKKATGDAHLKVILETGSIKDFNEIYKASVLAMDAGADFIKTSTEKEKIGATPEAVYVMATAIKDYFEKTGRKVGLKPAGGIKSSSDALLYLAIIKRIIGDDWLNKELFRLGTSSLANKLLTEITGSNINYY
jgi:deoxyribose-phosphate aldolase